MNTKQKFDRIDQTKLEKNQIDILKNIETKTNSFKIKDKELSTKVDLALDKIIASLLEKNPSAIKPLRVASKNGAKKTKTVVKRNLTAKGSANNIMSVAKEIQKQGESWKDALERSKQVLKERREAANVKVKTELDKLLALVKNRKELKGFANSDIKRDAVREARVKGVRFVSEAGFTTNAYGTFPNKLGRKYYENRDNRSDRLAPNYPKDMPMLSKGGSSSQKIVFCDAKTQKNRDLFYSEIKNLMPNHYVVKLGDLAVQIDANPTDLLNIGKIAKANEIALSYEDGGLTDLTIQEVVFKKGGNLNPLDKLLKELRTLQRDLNSHRLSTYREGDDSAEEMARQKERESKLNRFEEVLKELREIDAKSTDVKDTNSFEEGGDITDVTDAVFYSNAKKGKINTSFGDKTREGLLSMITNLEYSVKEISDAIFEYNESKGIIETGFGRKTKEGLSEMIKNARNTFEEGGSMSKLTEEDFLKKYFGASVYTENPSQYFEIKKLSSNNDDKISAFVKELKADGFSVKKRAYSDFTSVMGVKKKVSLELGGAFVSTDLAGHLGGEFGVASQVPINGISGTNYNGLVGETGALSSGELFELGGGVNDGKNGYIAFYRGKQMEVHADTSYEAQKKAATAFKARKSYDVSVVLAELDGKQVIYSPSFQSGGVTMFEEPIAMYKPVSGKLVSNSMSSEIYSSEIDEFVDYVEGFYGKNGIYKKDLNGGFTKKEIINAVDKYLQDLGETQSWGGGDSLDRERVRQYLDPSYSLLKDGGELTDSASKKIKEQMYLAFDLFLSNKINDVQLTAKLEKVLGKRKWFRYFKGDTLVSTPYSVSKFLGDSNRKAEIESMSISLKEKELQIYDYSGNEMLESGGAMMQNQSVIDGASQNYVITEGLGNPAQHLAKGGRVMSNYVNEIASRTGLSKKGVDDFFVENKLTDSDILNIMVGLGRGKIKSADISTAVSGVKGNKYSNELIAFAKSDEAMKMYDGGLTTVYANGGAVKGNLNKKVKELAESLGYTMDKLGRDEYNKIMTQALVESLTDANFHEEAKQVVAKYENEIWSDALYRSESFSPELEVAEFGRTVAFKCEWDGDDILNAYFFVTKMQGSKVAGMIEQLFFKKTQSFVPSVKFNTGDVVWQKDEKRYATVMNNYGNAISGDSGDIRLDTSGNTIIFTYDEKTFENTGYNLIKLGDKEDAGKFTPSVISEMKESANRLIDSRKESKDQEGVAYYKDVYKRLLSGDFDSMVKGTVKPTKYINNSAIKSVTLKLKGKTVTVLGEDVLNGANILEEGGDLSSKANYVAKRDIIAVTLKNGQTIESANGYWVKKTAKPIPTQISTNAVMSSLKNIDEELENFDLDDLDPFEMMQYSDFKKNMSKKEALQIIINNVEGDYSQLSNELGELAEKQISQDELNKMMNDDYAALLQLRRSGLHIFGNHKT